METATKFFEACETGKGWEGCKDFASEADAPFSSDAGALAGITTLEGYTNWMAGLISGIAPDGKYVLKHSSIDQAGKSAIFFAIFSGTHTGDKGPCPASGKHMSSAYVYHFELKDGKVASMTKIWNDGPALKAWGWA